MRAITVRQPWATAIVRMGKDVENRSRNIAGDYRGPVAIHAGSALPPGRRGTRTDFEGVGEVEYDLSGLLLRSPHLAWPYRLPTGVIIGVADLVDVHSDGYCWDRELRRLAALYHEDRTALADLPDNGAGGLIGKVTLCSPWAMGDHWHLHFADPRALAKPIPYKGQLGLWTLPDDVLAGVL